MDDSESAAELYLLHLAFFAQIQFLPHSNMLAALTRPVRTVSTMLRNNSKKPSVRLTSPLRTITCRRVCSASTSKSLDRSAATPSSRSSS